MRTAAGRDFQSRVMGDTASTGTLTYAAANYIALTSDATAPADGDTTLSGEYSATGGGLNRKQASYGHTAGANSYTLTVTFTVNALDTPPKTPQKAGVFNAATLALAGSLVFESLVPNPVALQLGDSITLTETVSLIC